MEIKLKIIELDFTSIKDLEVVHTILKHTFGFPDFYGKNVNALIDCWSSLRFPEDEMCMSIASNESLLLNIKGLTSTSNDIMLTLLVASEEVNRRYISRQESPPIYLELI